MGFGDIEAVVIKYQNEKNSITSLSGEAPMSIKLSRCKLSFLAYLVLWGEYFG